MEKFIQDPSAEVLIGLKVEKNTKIKFKNQYVEQKIENLKLYTKQTIKGQGYKSTINTEIKLKKGDVLLFEEEQRGYIKPVENFVSINDGIEILECVKE